MLARRSSVNPQTFDVYVDGKIATCEPAQRAAAGAEIHAAMTAATRQTAGSGPHRHRRSGGLRQDGAGRAADPGDEGAQSSRSASSPMIIVTQEDAERIKRSGLIDPSPRPCRRDRSLSAHGHPRRPDFEHPGGRESGRDVSRARCGAGRVRRRQSRLDIFARARRLLAVRHRYGGRRRYSAQARPRHPALRSSGDQQDRSCSLCRGERRADGARRRNEVRRGRPVMLTNCKTGEGVEAVVDRLSRGCDLCRLTDQGRQRPRPRQAQGAGSCRAGSSSPLPPMPIGRPISSANMPVTRSMSAACTTTTRTFQASPRSTRSPALAAFTRTTGSI